ncbi:MAG TPA: hypothetical protein VFS67_33315 [Polyangiaceae bacterium]|nr:hypothetical protein [Polyangiaceae bacterium]
MSGGTEQLEVIFCGQHRFQGEGAREREFSAREQRKERREFARQAREVDATASFVFAHVRLADAVVEQGAMRRLEVKAPLFHLYQVSHDLGQAATLVVQHPTEAIEQLLI